MQRNQPNGHDKHSSTPHKRSLRRVEMIVSQTSPTSHPARTQPAHNALLRTVIVKYDLRTLTTGSIIHLFGMFVDPNRGTELTVTLARLIVNRTTFNGHLGRNVLLRADHLRCLRPQGEEADQILPFRPKRPWSSMLWRLALESPVGAVQYQV